VVVSLQERPRIVITNRHLHEIAEGGWSALLRCNDPPVLFQHGGAIAEVAFDDDARARIAHLGLAALRGRLDRAAEWVKLTDNGLKPARPPRDVVEDIDALPKPLPVLRGIVGTPTFAPNGTLLAAPGYHASTGLYYAPNGEPLPPVREVLDKTRQDLVELHPLLRFVDVEVEFPEPDEERVAFLRERWLGEDT
jgi:hypothetical protein